MSYVFGAVALALLCFIVFLFKGIFSSCDFNSRREASDSTMLSLNTSIKQDIYQEALEINARTVRLNSEINNNAYCENIENQLLQLDKDRESNVRRSLQAGLLEKDAV
jgi:hypothetical protein